MHRAHIINKYTYMRYIFFLTKIKFKYLSKNMVVKKEDGKYTKNDFFHPLRKIWFLRLGNFCKSIGFDCNA